MYIQGNDLIFFFSPCKVSIKLRAHFKIDDWSKQIEIQSQKKELQPKPHSLYEN